MNEINPTETEAPPAEAAVAVPDAPATECVPNAPEAELRRLLRLRVPVIAQLATRSMPISVVRELSVGSIIEFEKSVEDALDLRVNNRVIGGGRCVKIGENFGLRISQICDRAERIRSMGKS